MLRVFPMLAGGPGPFDCHNPMLCSADVREPAALQKLCYRLVVTEGFLRVLARNAEGQESVLQMAKTLSAELGQILKAPHLDPTTRVSLEELTLLCQAIMMMLGCPTPRADALSEMKARPAFNVIKNFLAQSNYWRSVEKKCREQAAAVESFSPELQQLQQQLQQGVNIPSSERMAQRIAIWDEALPAGTCANESSQ